MIHRLGGKVKSLRERDGLSQTELAHHLRVRSRGYISDIESGKKIAPPDKILLLADLFQVTTDYLLRDEFDAPKDETKPR